MSDTDKKTYPHAQLLTYEQIAELTRINVLKQLICGIQQRALDAGRTPALGQLKAHNLMFEQGIDTIELLAASSMAMRHMIDKLVNDCVPPEKMEDAARIVCLGSDPGHFSFPINGCPSCGYPNLQKSDRSEDGMTEAEKDYIEKEIRRVAESQS